MDTSTIAAAGSALRSGQTTAADLTEHCLERIAAIDGTVRAFVTVTADRARADAERADQELRSGHDRGPLHGIPIAIKDLVRTRGIRTTAGSAVLADYVPDEDAAVVTRLVDAGAVLVGKTNTHEFAWGVFTPPTRNPWQLAHVPGGSSGGSAAAVATGMALGAIGTDTGGSIRIPSACCGVTGFKPTYGLVDTRGIIPLSTSLDHAGPIARSAQDCALLLDALTLQAPTHASSLGDPADLRMAMLGGPWEAEVEDATLQIVRHAASLVGPMIAPVIPPSHAMNELFAMYRAIQGPEACATHMEAGWYPQQADRYTAATRGALERAETVTATRYVTAQRQRARLRAAWLDWMREQQVDVLLAPTIMAGAPTIDEANDPERSRAAGERLLWLTFPFNLLGMPALSVPCGFTGEGLPLGLQVIAQPGRDDTVLAVGHALQQRSDWHERMPPL